MFTQTCGAAKKSKPIRLLLIEDNPDDANFIEEVLKLQESYLAVEIAQVNRLRDGLASLAKECFDVVLLDLSLPDATSTDSIARLLAQSPRLPIIVLTGLDDREIALDALQKGAQDYLIKDEVSGDVLMRSIRYAVERRKAENLARMRAAQEKEDLIFTLANDLRVPHIGAMRALDLLVQETLGPLNDEQKDMLLKVKQSSQEVLHMLQNLVYLYRSEQSGQKLLVVPTNLNLLIEQVIQEWSYLAGEHKVSVELISDVTEPVLLDSSAFKKVVSNLLHNAIKFSLPQNLVTITCKNEGNWLQLDVKDNGKGISESNKKNLFQRFLNDNDTMRHSNGSGVGLYVCRQIVEAHGGTIECESMEGVGTTVTVKIIKAS